jgi:hypothetical protein
MFLIPYDSFLIDGPWLVSIGWIAGKIINKVAKNGEDAKKAKLIIGVLTIVGFWVTSISLYFNMEWVRWMWEMCGAESGRDWMINSGVFNFDHENVSTKGHVIAALLFTTYPIWIKAGFKLAGQPKED